MVFFCLFHFFPYNKIYHQVVNCKMFFCFDFLVCILIRFTQFQLSCLCFCFRFFFSIFSFDEFFFHFYLKNELECTRLCFYATIENFALLEKICFSSFFFHKWFDLIWFCQFVNGSVFAHLFYQNKSKIYWNQSSVFVFIVLDFLFCYSSFSI